MVEEILKQFQVLQAQVFMPMLLLKEIKYIYPVLVDTEDQVEGYLVYLQPTLTI